MLKKANLLQGARTPNIEKSEGVRPAQKWVPAGYLPVVRKDDLVGDYKVISYGKVVAPDSSSMLVPAGLKFDIVTALGAGHANKAAFIADAASFTHVYTATDVYEGVKNFQGTLVTVNEPVVASFFEGYDASDAANQNNFIGKAIGLAPQDIWRQNGAGQAGNPMDYNFTNWNLQSATTVLTRYFIELPVVDNYASVVYPGIMVFEGRVSPGDLVTFNANSNLVSVAELSKSTFAALAAGDPTDDELKAEFDRIIDFVNTQILGKVMFVDTVFPKDFLQYVKTWNPNITGMTTLDKAPGSATQGLPDHLTYAGITNPAEAKTVRINVLI